MDRRNFLSLLGGGLALPLSGSGASASPIGGRVIVVGAGFSGLCAALALAEQGLQVEVIEAQERIGGRYASWREQGPGGWISVGHTPLTVSPADTALREFLDATGVSSHFEPHSSVWSWRIGGRLVSREALWGRLHWGAALWKHARGMGDRGIPLRLQRGSRWLRSASATEVVAQVGKASIAGWQQETGALTPWTALDELLAPVLFDGVPSEVDASSFLLAEQRWRHPAREAPLLRPSENGEESIWGEIRGRLESMGVRFQLGVEVSEVRLAGGRVTGLTLGEFQPGAWAAEAPQGWSVVEREGAPPVHLRRDSTGLLEAFSSPNARPEEALYVVEGADGIHIEGEDRRRHLNADSVVLACGPESAWALAGDLLTTPHVPVVRERISARFWLGSPLSPDSPTWVVADGKAPAMGTVLSRIEADSRAWADDDATVVCVEMPMGALSEEENLREALLEVVGRCWPELDDAPLIDSRVHRWWVPLKTPGFAARESVVATVPGLQLAGEHLPVEAGAFGAEAAARSGRVAAARALQAMR
ncbi:MAG: FAD-dependent oxidoreductase [Myxococcota bacterium]|nr:FAD-dependent oxidoreductase [Myxococcota bacterium]